MSVPEPAVLEPLINVLGFSLPKGCPSFDLNRRWSSGLNKVLERADQFAKSMRRFDDIAYIKFHEGLYRFAMNDYVYAISCFQLSCENAMISHDNSNSIWLMRLGTMAQGLIYHHNSNYIEAAIRYNEVHTALNELNRNLESGSYIRSRNINVANLKIFLRQLNPIWEAANTQLERDIEQAMNDTLRI